MIITMMDPAKLTPYENNPRDNDASVPRVKASIQEFGFKQPIVATSDGTIIAGHTRLKAALELGLKEVPVIVADDLTDEQARAYRLADNKAGEASEWILPSLQMELDSIEGIDMTQFGFEVPEPDLGDSFGTGMGDGSGDEIPEADEVEPTVRRGQIWILGEHRLMCGDATKEEDVDALMDGDTALMMFTDPPYNVAVGDKNRALNEMDGGTRIEKPIENDQYESDEAISEALWLPAFSNARRVCDPYCSYYMTMPQGGTHMMMMMMMMKAGWQVKHELVWVKNNHVLSRADYNYQHEPILFGWNEKHRFYGEGQFQNSTWEVPRPNNSDLHPTMKPVALVVNALLNSSVKGDTVLDPFGGSGTTLMACEQTQRRCRMMELDPRYCDVIIARWEKATGRKAELMEGSRWSFFTSPSVPCSEVSPDPSLRI